MTASLPLRLFLLGAASAFFAVSSAEETPAYLTYDNTPLGTRERPLVLRTYLPDPDLDEAVFANHHHGASSPKYNVTEGRDVAGEYQPAKGIPGAIAVNHGAALSYCFDTTECRLLYAWQGGFLDMFPYWGDQERGSRQAFNYVPHLVGNLFFKATGNHPVHLDGKSLTDLGPPRFLGYSMRENQPEFLIRVGAHEIRYAVQPSPEDLAFTLVVQAGPGTGELGYRTPDGTIHRAPAQDGDPTLTVEISGPAIATYQGFPRDMKITEANAAAGEKLYLNYGCVACHSTDGSKGHGPTFSGLFGRTRALEDGGEILADDAYLLESIKAPNARTAAGFPPNYMPPYQLKEIEYQALLAFLKNLAQPE